MSDVEIKPGQFAVHGKKQYKVVAVDGDAVTLFNPDSKMEFASRVSKLISGGYVLVDSIDDAKGARGVAAKVSPAPALTVAAGEEADLAEKSPAENPDLFGAKPEAPAAASLEAEQSPAQAAVDASAAGRRVRTPAEIVDDLVRRQDEERAKVELRYKEKIFKASQRLKSLPQKRDDALRLMEEMRQTVRRGAENPFMTDDEADAFIRRAVDHAALSVEGVSSGELLEAAPATH